MCDRARQHSGLGPKSGEIPRQFDATDQSGLVEQCFSGNRALWDQALDSHLIDAQLGFFIRRSSEQTFDGRSARIFFLSEESSHSHLMKAQLGFLYELLRDKPRNLRNPEKRES